MPRARFLHVAVLAAALLAALPAAAQEPSAGDRETARALMSEGDAAAEALDWARALERYRSADVLVRLPSTGLRVAETLVRMGRLIEARDEALRVSRLAPRDGELPVHAEARAAATALAASLAPRIGEVRIAVRGAEGAALEVLVDGAAVRGELRSAVRRVDPGVHTVEARAPGFAPSRVEVTVAEGGSAEASLTLVAVPGAPVDAPPPLAPRAAAPAPPPASAGTHPLVWTGIGVGGAGLLVGAIGGVVSLGAASSASSQCGPDDVCPRTAEEDIDAAKTTAWVSNIGFGVAVVGAGLLVVGLILDGEDEPNVAGATSCSGSRDRAATCLRF